MQMRKAAQRRKEWGEKPCNHDDVDREYYLGAHTGDIVCTICGRNFTNMEEVESDRQKQREQKKR